MQKHTKNNCLSVVVQTIMRQNSPHQILCLGWNLASLAYTCSVPIRWPVKWEDDDIDEFWNDVTINFFPNFR